jgi:hypothetical protein
MDRSLEATQPLTGRGTHPIVCWSTTSQVEAPFIWPTSQGWLCTLDKFGQLE